MGDTVQQTLEREKTGLENSGVQQALEYRRLRMENSSVQRALEGRKKRLSEQSGQIASELYERYTSSVKAYTQRMQEDMPTWGAGESAGKGRIQSKPAKPV